MNKDRKLRDLQHESLKKQPFGVPGGYFESFSERLQERIREEENSRPVRRIVTGSRFRIAMAAAMVGLALITYSVIKFTNTENGSNGYLPDMAVLEQLQVFDDDSYLYELIGEVEEEMDEEEAFATQAIEYLAINDAEMVLLFE
ncbi:MAG: hypothetical protein ABFS28_14210 [Bacteroidota bacterium]